MVPTPTRDARPPSAGRGRHAGQAAILGGAILAALMAYALLPWGSGVRKPPQAPADSVDVAVFFPDRVDWEDFRGGTRAVAAKELAEVVADTTTTLTLKTRQRQRTLRFTWHGVGGVIETREEARRLADSPRPPAAVVGSANSLLTAALAVALRPRNSSTGRPVPLLLVPWATAILVDDPAGGLKTVPLLQINPGRTFRFCANNQRLANLVVNCLGAQRPPAPPGRVLLVVDREDGFSKDLAESFTRAIATQAPGVEARTFDLRETGPPSPDSAEKALASKIWEEALAVSGDRVTWVVLPLQQGPTLRMINALRVQGWYMTMTGGARLQVLCGDSLRAEDLREMVTQVLPFPVWASSSASASGSVAAGLGARQVPAEVVSSLVRWADRAEIPPGSSESLRQALEALDLKADDPAALGRPLAFEPSGERQGQGLGSVLAVEPGRDSPAAFTQDPSGRWVEIVPNAPTATATKP